MLVLAVGCILTPGEYEILKANILDTDKDGYVEDIYGGLDCDDEDRFVNPGMEETWYNGVDDDCLPTTVDDDQDGDGWNVDEDCDDRDPLANPDQEEHWYDGVDQDCDGADDFDQDGDGVVLDEDCDDENAAVFPSATETCNELDDDCDDAVDEDAEDAQVWYLDEDGDGWGGDTSQVACDAPADHVAQTGDCDDDEVLAAPDLEESCNDGIDNDCDGTSSGCALEGELSLLELGWTLTDPGAGQLGWDLAAGDLDGDETLDVASTALDDEVVHLWYGVTGARSTSDLTLAGNGRAVVIEDLDRDGLDDLAFTTDDGVMIYSSPCCSSSVYLPLDVDADTIAIGFGLSGAGPYPGLLVGRPDSLSIYPGSESGAFSSSAASVITSTDNLNIGLRVTGWQPDGSVASIASGRNSSDEGGTGSGAVYIFDSPHESDRTQDDADLVLTGSPGSGAGVGLVSGDTNNDGYQDLLIGAPGDSSAGTNAGAVFILLEKPTGDESLVNAPVELVGEPASLLGVAIAMPQDLDGDGIVDVAATAPFYDSSSYTGAVMVFYGPLSGVVEPDAILVGEAGSQTGLGGVQVQNHLLVSTMMGGSMLIGMNLDTL